MEHDEIDYDEMECGEIDCDTMDSDDEMKSDDENYLKFYVMASSATALIATYYYKYIYKEPCMTSLFTGEIWIHEILNGNPIRCVNAFRMEPDLFKKLCNDLSQNYGLQPSDRVSVFEKVGIFLYIIASSASNRMTGERFQRSGDTISRVFHEVLDKIAVRGVKCLAGDIIKPRDPKYEHIPPQIANDDRYMPYFKDCIGCIDGTHVKACIPESEQQPFRGRKGDTTFNVMATCDFDMCFTFVSSGWEGSAHDARVFLHAIQTPELNFPNPPEGRYYLVDKGYPDRKGYLVPYSKLRYHQSQFQNEAPKNAKESFNRVHSSLRSCIERSFGVLKQRWKILTKLPQFSVDTQTRTIMATFALHNYIRINSPNDRVFQVLEKYPDYIPADELSRTNLTNVENTGHRSGMKDTRDRIAESLWRGRQGN